MSKVMQTGRIEEKLFLYFLDVFPLSLAQMQLKSTLLILPMFAQLSHLICCQPRAAFPTPYTFPFGGESHLINAQIFQGNGVKTTKYNMFNFLPKSIITQYRRLANLFFLIVAAISTVPNVTPLNPGLIWAPLVFVLIISLVKQLYEDYTRFKTDEQVNQLNSVSVLRGGRLQTLKWKDVVVGDICMVKDKETFPADLVLISSSDRDGLAYIQTATLDGELTSKTRYAFQELNGFNSQEELARFSGTFEAAAPSYSLAEFKGSFNIGQQRLAMTDNSQLLFRGAKLKNTEWIWGLVIYTGQCSKIMMNGQNFTTKLSSLQRKLNYLLVVLLLAQTAVCVIIAAISVRSQRTMMDSHTYLYWQNKNTNSYTFVMNFLMFFIEFSSSIPVSLIVTIEIAKTAQSYFIDFDQLMFSSWRKRKTFARIASLNEELGQVEYVFCDKTGTLTKNLLKFHTAVVGNVFYQFGYSSEDDKYSCQKMAKALQGVNRIRGEEQLSVSLASHSEVLQLYLLGLLVCNNVSTVGDQSQSVTFESQSPDEIALIKMAKDMGYQLLKRDKNSLVVNVQGTISKIQVIGKFNFTSQRKRMSTIIKWKDSLLIFTKGADNVILERSIPSQFNVANSIDSLSYKGLRSLLLAFRTLSTEQVRQFKEEYQHAAMEEKEIVKQHYSDVFQQKLTIIGATGLLDELQDGVPETLRDLQRAGIKVWMLTGDKLETALEVGKSCNLIENNYEIILLRDTVRSIKDQFEDSRRVISTSGRKCSLIIQGSILAIIFSDPELVKEFTELTLFLQSVICCRLLPVQKSQVVKMIKENLEKVCLAVGDGGNDVSMIKQASIGVGLYGEEGMSAVQASDYAIPEFRMLWRLLFVHGRWNYIRISQMVLYFVFKSLIFTIPRILFQFYNAYSGYPLYDDYYIACYNVVFTALPLLIRALFQQDFNYVVKAKDNEASMQASGSSECLEEKKYLPKGYTINQGMRKLFPKIYFIGQNNMCFNLKECFLWVAEALLMGIAIFFVIKASLGMHSINQMGLNDTLPFLSLTVFTGVVMIVTVKLCMQVKHWTKMLFFTVVVLSVVPYISFMWFINSYFNRPVSRILTVCFTTAKGYLSVSFLILLLVGFNGLLNFTRFSSHRILKRMAIALEEDDQMISYLSSQRDGIIGDQLRRSDNPLKEKPPRRCGESQGIIA